MAISLSFAQVGVAASEPNGRQPQPYQLSLAEAIDLSLRNNPNVESATLQRVIDKFALVVAHNAFEWQYRLTGNAFWQQGSSSGQTSRSRGWQLTPEAQIKSATGLQFSTQFPQISNDGSHYHPSLSFTATQPLLRGAGSNVNLVNLRNSEDQEKINQLQLKDTIMNVVISVIRDYRALQQSQLIVQIQETNLNDANENLQQTKARIKAGQLPPRSVVEIERQIAEQALQLEIAKNSRDQASLVLLRDLWIDPQTALLLPNDIDAKLAPLPQLNNSYQTALLYNIQYQVALLNLAQQERNLIQAKDNLRPQLDLEASHQLGGSGGNGPDAGLESLFNGRNDATRFTLNLDIPIDNKSLQQGVVNLKTQLKQARLGIELTKRELHDSIRTAIRDLSSQRTQITLSMQAEKLARESLALEKRKQLYGKATQLDVTSARRNLINAENATVNSKITYLNTLTEFRRLLGVTLDHWKVELVYT